MLAAAVHAQQARVGVLANTIPPAELSAGRTSHPAIRSLVTGLTELGWHEGRNIQYVWRSAEGDFRKLPKFADELAAESVDVIVAYGPGVSAAMHATHRIPIVMGASGVIGREVLDGKVRVESLARPGGNVTGLSLSGGADLNGKRLEILKSVAPSIRRVGVLYHEATGFGPKTRAAARAMGITLQAFGFRSDVALLEPAFAAMVAAGMDAAIVVELPATNLPAVQAAIHRLAERHRLPVMHEVLSAVDSGGLMAYGADINKLYRRVPYFVDRILRGVKPADMPIEQPADFELRINLRAARVLGLEIPAPVLIQASKVVE